MDREWGTEAVALLTQLARGTSDIIWMFSRDWDDLVFVNGAYESVYGRSIATLEEDSRDFLNGIFPEDRERVRAAMDRLSSGEPVELEYRVNPEEEYGRWVWVKGWPVYDDDDEVVRVAGFSRDVTARKRQEWELHRQNERLDEFASVVAHDLRNPLGIAKGRLTLAQEECESEHLEPAVTALDRMADIIDATLTLTRYGRTVTDPVPVPIGNVVWKCWEMVETGDAELELEAEFDVLGDPEQLRHLFENLFRNAVEHGSTGRETSTHDAVEHGSTGPASRARQNAVEHGSADGRSEGEESPEDERAQDAPGEERDRITVRVGSLDGGFYVEDDGPGVPESARETVFEPGFTTASDGTGLGTTIVKRVAEAHGWSVGLTESAEGGARFEFTSVR